MTAPGPGSLTPMMAQYRRIKEQHPAAIVFFRLGDFFETFDEDAAVVARELEITLTSRDLGRAGRVPMAGIPHHAVDGYLARLLDRGYRVAICDQVELPAPGRGLVRREVTRVVTPGTTVDPRALDERAPNYLAVIASGGDGCLGLAWCDFSTGEFRVTQWSGPAAWEDLLGEMAMIGPREVLADPAVLAPDGRPGQLARLGMPGPQPLAGHEPEPERAGRSLAKALGTVSLAAFGLEGRPGAVVAAAALIRYLKTTQLETARWPEPRYWDRGDRMTLDPATRKHLELVANSRDGGRAGSLLGAIDLTLTPMGGRLLRDWLLAPLVRLEPLQARQARVAALVEHPFWRAEARQRLRDCPDLARLVSRARAGLANARDLAAVGRALARVPGLAAMIGRAGGDLPPGTGAGLEPQPELEAQLASALADAPPVALDQGGLIRDGYDPEVDRLRALRRGGRDWLAEFEARERGRTGIRSLRVGYNRVFGYYIEVTRPNLAQVPAGYTRRQTLATGERFVTEELKQREAEILGAEEQLCRRESQLFVELRERVAAAGEPLLALSAALAEIDCYAALAEVAAQRGYVRPELGDAPELGIEAGRHPVLELTLERGFVPNDLCLAASGEAARVMVVTGPNMAGKSTYLRQAALLVLLAQAGSYVPAQRARIGLADRVFTRIGAQDDLSAGQSTFMVEMQEVAHILRHATPRSLVILDEVGRGTSTFDGISLARAVVEHLADLGCRTLFATHYHELIGVAATRDSVANYSTAVLDQGDEIVFLHQVRPGGADRSYGVEVARLAGVPGSVLERAKELLSAMELSQAELAGSDPTTSGAAGSGGGARRPGRAEQLSFLEPPASPILEELRALKVSALTPLEALNLLARWQEAARRKPGRTR